MSDGGKLFSPHDRDIDVFGATHPGLVRDHNEDQFLICSLHRETRIHATSLPKLAPGPFSGERLGFLGLVADGVGGLQAGEVASQLATESVAEYVSRSAECFFSRDLCQKKDFLHRLYDTVMDVHEKVLDEAAAGAGREGMATTLTMLITVWPEAYVVQVGDSRCYRLRGEELQRVTKDQTVAQELLDQGLDETETEAWSHVLASSIGGSSVSPVVSQFDLELNDVMLMCSDGLTDMVDEEAIRKRLIAFDTAESTCNDLIQLALEGGGKDNVTVMVGSPRAK